MLVLGLAIVAKLKFVDSSFYADDEVHLNDASDGSHTVVKRQMTSDYVFNHEKRLIDHLFKNYQVKFGRPVNNMSEKVVVYFGIYLIQIIDLVNYFFLFNFIFFIQQAKFNFFLISITKKGRTKSSAYFER